MQFCMHAVGSEIHMHMPAPDHRLGKAFTASPDQAKNSIVNPPLAVISASRRAQSFDVGGENAPWVSGSSFNAASCDPRSKRRVFWVVWWMNTCNEILSEFRRSCGSGSGDLQRSHRGGWIMKGSLVEGETKFEKKRNFLSLRDIGSRGGSVIQVGHWQGLCLVYRHTRTFPPGWNIERLGVIVKMFDSDPRSLSERLAGIDKKNDWCRRIFFAVKGSIDKGSGRADGVD
ncbi:hypothetical protein BXZ70DRAFT_909554 [Cristinia sonorae]|uniref:Uncharacterized protein n=1 Tax=Cristinia sonorae TaxID=1940300 RepID=A0A8K0XLW3_9AGAR|nr:hypothetical protein BXZ70DRAFT_909554 [Cristinia sonorae]